MREKLSFRFDVALSFAGEDREYVEALAAALRARNVSLFYSGDQQSDLWGKDLHEHLFEIYQNQARFCVMFLSEHYARKPWTKLERRAAQARAFEAEEDYILPIRLDDTEIPGIPPTIYCVYWAHETCDNIADMVADKLNTRQAPVRVEGPTHDPFERSQLPWNAFAPAYEQALTLDQIGGDHSRCREVMAGVLDFGENGSWKCQLLDDAYELCNFHGTDDVRYYYVGIRNTDMSGAVSVEVSRRYLTGSTDFSGGGLIYRFDSDRRFYYAFLLQKNGVYSLYKRNVNGFQAIYSGSISDADSDRFTKLTITSAGAALGLFINDRLARWVEDDELPAGDVGIVGMSVGAYRYRNFSIQKGCPIR